MRDHIHSIFDKVLPREEKEGLLNQRGKVIWLTGLSGSGKSTLAVWLERKFHEEGILVKILDGDNIRTGICNNLGFSDADRSENIRRIAEISKLFVECGVVTINSFVSPTNKIRGIAKKIIGEDDFIEVHVNTPLEECERRDVKGLYKKARNGEIKNFTGIDAPFETPENPAITIRTKEGSIEECGEKLYQFVINKIKH